MEAMQDKLVATNLKHIQEMTVLHFGKKAMEKMRDYIVVENLGKGYLLFNARLVAKRCTQNKKIDVFEGYSSLSKYSTISLVLALFVYFGQKYIALDVKTVLLGAGLNEEIYIDYPDGSENPRRTGNAYQLYKPLYGMKQALQHFIDVWKQSWILKGFWQVLLTHFCLYCLRLKNY